MARTTRAVLGLLLAGSTALGLMTVAGSASAATARHASKAKALKGTITCALTGTITAKPALTLSTPKATTLTFSGKLTGCKTSKKSKVKIKGGKLSGKTRVTTDCVALTKSLPALNATVKYKTSHGTAAATKLMFSGGTLDVTGSPVTVTYPGTGDTGKSTGSFAGKSASLVGDISQSPTTLTSKCEAGTMKTLTIKKKGSSFKA